MSGVVVASEQPRTALSALVGRTVVQSAIAASNIAPAAAAPSIAGTWTLSQSWDDSLAALPGWQAAKWTPPAASAGELVLGREDLREADREGPDANKVSRRAKGGQLTLALGSDGEWRARSREGALWPAGLQRRGSRPEPIATAEPVALRHGDILYLVSQPLLKRYPLLVRLPPSGDCVAADECEAARRAASEANGPLTRGPCP